MDLSNQAQTNRQVLQSSQTIVHGPYVVHYLFHVLRKLPSFFINFKLQHVFEGALRAFNWELRTASCRTYMDTNRSGLGTTAATPSKRPRERSASESNRASSASI